MHNQKNKFFWVFTKNTNTTISNIPKIIGGRYLPVSLEDPKNPRDKNKAKAFATPIKKIIRKAIITKIFLKVELMDFDLFIEFKFFGQFFYGLFWAID